MINVLHTEWSDGWGGQEIRTIDEMIALRETGVNVFLACKNNSKIKERAIENNIEVFILDFKGNTDFKTLFKLIRIIKDRKIDIVNTHSGKDTWIGGFAAKIAGAKFIRTRHLSNKIRSSRLNFINELADYIFTTGEIVKNDMIKYNRIDKKKIISIPTGIDEKVFDPNLFNREECRLKYNIKKDDIAIGIIAVIREFKRHDLFIESAEKLLYNNSNLKFFIAGDGPKKNKMEILVKEKRLSNNIIFLGHVNNPAELLSALDIFVLTSDSKEGVPQSVMQALLMNKKVVATDVGSTRDLYFNNNFKLIKPSSITEIVNAVQFFINNKDINVSSRDFIVDEFSKHCMVDKISKVYNKLVNK